MRPLLRQEIAALLRERGPMSVDSIALTVRARRADVAEALRTGAFEAATPPLGANPSARYFTASQTVPQCERDTRRRGPSQCDRILAVLADRRPHSMQEIHLRVGFCRLNSRAAELRSRGYEIVCDKTDRRYVYTLVSSPDDLLDEPADATRSTPPSPVSPVAKGDAAPLPAGSSSGPTGSADHADPSSAEARSILTLFPRPGSDEPRGAYGEAA